MNAHQRRITKRKIQFGICPNCGEQGPHWIQSDWMPGFWTCPKLYGPDGKRLPEHTDRNVHDGLIATMTLLSAI